MRKVSVKNNTNSFEWGNVAIACQLAHFFPTVDNFE